MSKPIASVDRPLALRLRPDLIAAPVEMTGVTTWVVKDPVTLEHFQFSAEEYALLDWLRQPASIAQLQRQFADEFAPQTISPQGVWDFLSRLHGAGLLVGDAPGQGHELLARMRKERARRWALSWMGLLAIRFRGVDPDVFLTAAHRRLGRLFSPAAFLGVLLVLMYAASLVVGHYDEFRARLPEISALLDVRNLIWLLLTIGVVKVLHELGHALACKHFGGEVRELGLMLLVFAPCLYCDVSDAWRLNSKWRRIGVSAAGMVVELVLAAVATIVWWHANPGLIQLLALNVMIVCTVGTLLVNGNPLLRYDGYYILSDLVETPNLWQRSREALRRVAMGWLLGEPASSDDPLVPASHRAWLVVYGAASKSYVALVCAAIVWGLVQVLHPLHLENLAYMIGFTVVAGALFGPANGLLRLACNPLRRAELRKARIALLTSLGTAAIVLLLAMPVSYYVRAPLVLLPADAARVYATVEGTLVMTRAAGEKVSRGDVIGQLTNVEAERELARLEGEFRHRQLRVEHLEKLRGLDPEANNLLPTARAALADSERRLEDRRQEAARWILTSPVDGVLIHAPRVTPTSTTAARLPTWSGSLLEPNNLGAHLEPGTLVCLVGDPANLLAELLVDDANVKRLAPGQSVRLRIDQLPGRVVDGKVVEVSRHVAGDEASATAKRADLTPLLAGLRPPGRFATTYQVSVRFDPPQQSLVIGGRGEAKVTAERITLARRIARFFAQAFRLPM